MRKLTPIIALVILILLPGFASAVYLDSVTGTADCNGWNAAVEVTFRSGARSVRLDYTVVLAGPDGLEIERFEYSEPIEIPTQDTVVYSFGEAWTADMPEGANTMSGTFVLFDIFPDGTNRFEDGFTATFDCGGAVDDEDDPVVTDFCPRGNGFWKNHPTDWPVMNLDLGTDNLDQTALLEILDSPARGDATVILARHLITAKLNMAAGAGDQISTIIAEADDYLTIFPVFSKPGKADRRAALDFLDDFGEYNSGDCSEASGQDEQTNNFDAGKHETVGFDKAAATEVMTMGSVKALFR